MTEEMLNLAQRNAREAGVRNAVFLRGVIEDVPLPADSVDVVISNCVINLSTEKPAVFAELARVLKPGGRIGISDVVAEDRLTPQERAERGSYVGCIAGALSKGEYEAAFEAAGFVDVSVEFTHEVADGIHGAMVKRPGPPASSPRSRSPPRLQAAADRLLAPQELVGDRPERGADQRREQVDPERSELAGDQRGPERARRVHRRAAHGPAD